MLHTNDKGKWYFGGISDWMILIWWVITSGIYSVNWIQYDWIFKLNVLTWYDQYLWLKEQQRDACVMWYVCPFRDPNNYTGISWFEAEGICKKDGGTLASILSKDDLDAVKFHFQNVASIYGQFVYIGLKISKVSLTLVFTSLPFCH